MILRARFGLVATLTAWQSHERLVLNLHSFDLIWPFVSNSIARRFQVFAFLLPIFYLVLLRPRQHRIEVSAHLHHVEIWIRHKLSMALPWNPIVRNDIKVGMTHKCLQQDMDAVRPVVQPPPRRLLVSPVVLPVQVFTQPIKAMDLMESIELEDVCIVPSTPRGGRFDGIFWSFLTFGECEGCGGEDGAGEKVPCCVDFWTGILTED